MRQTVFFLILLFTASVSLSQDNLLDPDYQESILDSLREEFGSHKRYPQAYEVSILTALSYYPELKQVSITFRRKNIRTTMSALPHGLFLLTKDEKRKYVINIGTNGAISSLLLPELSFNARVGVIGHELAHIVDYETMSKGDMIIFSRDYLLSKDKRSEIERKTDKIAIGKGLGKQVYFFSDYVFNHANVPRKYLKYKERIYFSPDEIANILEIEK